MDNSMDGSRASGKGMEPLSPHGVDFANSTQASDFLAELLDDTILQVIGNRYARYFWCGTATFIGIVAAANLFRRITLRNRLKEALHGRKAPARPKNPLMRVAATITAICRELSHSQLSSFTRPLYFSIPPLGHVIVILLYLGFVLALEFGNNDVQGAQYYQALGVRAAWLAIAQVPLLVLLIGKYNWIGLVTGVGYERLNVLHRWVARVLLLLATFHFAFQAGGWNRFTGIFHLEWSTDVCVPTGLATYIILIWMNLSTLAPFRNLCYEFFVIQHIITFFGFIVALVIHLPTTALYSRTYIYIPIALYLFDRLIRFLRFSFVNIKPNRASVEGLDGSTTKITFRNSRVRRWVPGAHVLISFPTLGFGQNHPATVLSTPCSHGGDLVLLLKARRGFTSCLYRSASKFGEKSEAGIVEKQSRAFPVFVDGPFGGRMSDFAAFDSVCLIAGSTGITFVLANLLDLAQRAEATGGRLPVRRVDIVWCVKKASDVHWVSKELASALRQLHQSGVETDVGVFITCGYGSMVSSEKTAGCRCDKSLGLCCCIHPEEKTSRSKMISMLYAGAMKDGKREEATPRAHVDVQFRRPMCRDIIERTLFLANGETAVAVCGPLSMVADVRNAVAGLSDQRGVHKGTGAQGVYLHVEGFSQ